MFFCGLILDSLDAWLFTQINGGNAISLALNKGFGWAADVNLNFIFDRIFSVEKGCGYPEHRKMSQAESRTALEGVSAITHKEMHKILLEVPENIMSEVINFPGIIEIINPKQIKDDKLSETVKNLMEKYVR